MEILNEYKKTREGNDCMLYDYICLIRLDYHMYTVIHVDAVQGRWTGEPKSLNGEFFTDYPDALDYMDKLVAKL